MKLVWVAPASDGGTHPQTSQYLFSAFISYVCVYVCNNQMQTPGTSTSVAGSTREPSGKSPSSSGGPTGSPPPASANSLQTTATTISPAVKTVQQQQQSQQSSPPSTPQLPHEVCGGGPTHQQQQQQLTASSGGGSQTQQHPAFQSPSVPAPSQPPPGLMSSGDQQIRVLTPSEIMRTLPSLAQETYDLPLSTVRKSCSVEQFIGGYYSRNQHYEFTSSIKVFMVLVTLTLSAYLL